MQMRDRESSKESTECNEAKTRFLFNMSHDIRMSMNAIIGFTALLDRMIEVDSELGKVTTITITVEFSIAKNEKSADSNKKNTVKQSENGGGRILLAEDNDLNAEIAVTLLKEREFEVDRAKDGAVCIDMVKEKPVDYYNLILMDIQMPSMWETLYWESAFIIKM